MGIAWNEDAPITPGPGGGEYVLREPPEGKVLRPPGYDPEGAGQTLSDTAMAGTNLFGMAPRVGAVVNRALGTTAQPDYSGAVDELAKQYEDARNRSPVASTAAEAVGAAVPGAGLSRLGATIVPRAGNMLGRIGAGLIEGGAYGAATGAGNTYSGNPSDYTKNALIGGVFNGALGATTPVIGAAAGAGYQALAGQGFRGSVPGSLARSAQTDQAGLLDILTGRASPLTMLPDVGPSMLGTAQGAVLNPERPGQAALVRALADRNAGQGQRVTAAVQQFGPTAPPEVAQAAVQRQITAMSPRYDDAYARAHAVDTQPLANWLEAQATVNSGAARDELLRLRRELDIQGVPGTLDPHPRRLGAVRSDVTGRLGTPGLDPNVSRVLGQARDQMTAELQANVPGIRRLDSERAELGSQFDALARDSLGSRVFDTSRAGATWPQQFQTAMTEGTVPKGLNVGPSGEAFQVRNAVRAELERIVGSNRFDLNALNQTLGQPQDWNAQKLAITFGPDRAERLMQVLSDETNFRNTHTKVNEGAQTANRLAAIKAQEPLKLPGGETLYGDAKSFAKSLGNALLEGNSATNRDRIARVMATTDQQQLRAIIPELLNAQPTRDRRAAIVNGLLQNGILTGGAGVVSRPIDKPANY